MRRLAPGTVRLALACVVGGLAVGAVLSVATWLTLEKVNAAVPSVYDIVIPLGTSQKIGEGAAAPSIPSIPPLEKGDTLRIRNDDAVAHQIGPFLIDAGTEREIAAEAFASPGASNRFLCTFHAGSSIDLTVREGTPITATLLPTLLLGLPIGIAGFAIVTFTSRFSTSA